MQVRGGNAGFTQTRHRYRHNKKRCRMKSQISVMVNAETTDQ